MAKNYSLLIASKLLQSTEKKIIVAWGHKALSAI